MPCSTCGPRSIRPDKPGAHRRPRAQPVGWPRELRGYVRPTRQDSALACRQAAIRRRASRAGTHAVVSRVVLELGKSKRLHQRGHVHPEPAAEALLCSIPTSDGVLLGPCPRLDGALRGILLFICGTERDPVSVLFEHLTKILDRAQLVAERRLANSANQRACGLIAVHLIGGRSRRGFQDPWSPSCPLHCALQPPQPPIAIAVRSVDRGDVRADERGRLLIDAALAAPAVAILEVREAAVEAIGLTSSSAWSWNDTCTKESSASRRTM